MFKYAQQTVSKYFRKVLQVVLEFKSDFVVFPDEEECTRIKRALYHKYGLPNCIGIVDGTHIRL